MYIYICLFSYSFALWFIKRILNVGFPGVSDGKESAWNSGNMSSVAESGRSPGEGNGNPLQCSRLENPMNRGARQAAVHGVAKSRT